MYVQSRSEHRVLNVLIIKMNCGPFSQRSNVYRFVTGTFVALKIFKNQRAHGVKRI